MKHRWLIPVFFMMLAILACDPPYYDLLRVQQVQADPDTPGRAYALIRNSDTTTVYETDDYGDHWRRSAYHFPDEARNSYALQFRQEILSLDNRPLWTFPRSTFRSFFNDESGVYVYFNLPYGSLSNSAAGDMLYVAMGTEGVLVGPAPGGDSDREWTLTADGIDLLDPVPLTLTDPLAIFSVIALALLIPPLPLIHAYILSRVWAYILPRRLAWCYAAWIALGLSALAAGAIALWLTKVEVEYGWIVGGMTIITAGAGIGLTAYFAREQAVPAGLRNRLVIVALFASLVVPLGVIGVFALWWLIFLIVFGYRAYSDLFFRGIVGDKRKAKNKRQQWLIDHLAFETLIGAGSVAILVGLGIGIADILFAIDSQVDWLLYIPGIVISILLISAMARARFLQLATMQEDFDPDEDFDIGRFRSDITAATIKWAVFALGAAALTFVAQMWAYGWFQNLLW